MDLTQVQSVKMPKRTILIYILCTLVSSDSFALSGLENIGELVPTSFLTTRMTFARIETKEEMCSPAVLIGPRTFLTAAHCTPLIPSDGVVKVIGPSIVTSVKVEIISMPVIRDDDFFAGKRCRRVIDGVVSGDTLSPLQLGGCWFNGGAGDIALLVTDQDIQASFVALDLNPTREGELLNRIGENATCGGDQGFFHRVHLKVSSFTGSQMVLENKGAGPIQDGLSACGGDSGAIYYREDADKGIRVVGVHSASISSAGPYKILGKNIYLPTGYFGGTNLAEAKSTSWLKREAASRKLQICGLNLACAPVSLN